MTLAPRVLGLLDTQGAEEVLVMIGATIPHENIAMLERLGVAKVFTPGAATDEIVRFITTSVRRSMPPRSAIGPVGARVAEPHSK
jgi:methylmalonyl-CoA mutase, C-terminal domain